jgi:gliding motility-associated-like protein
MYKLLAFLIVQMIVNHSYTQQNLIYNGDFEIYDTCPTSMTQISNCVGWYSPSLSTPDYFNSCANNLTTPVNVPYSAGGFQRAFSGEAYCGIVGYSMGTIPPDSSYYWVEYIQTELANSLNPGKFYKATMRVNLHDISNTANSRLMIHLSNNPMLKSDGEPYYYNIFNSDYKFITDTSEWIQIQKYFIASGDERYVTIGVFYHESRIDTLILDNAPTPDFQTSYYLIDDVQLVEIEFLIPNIFTPNNDNLNDFVDFSMVPSEYEVFIYNRWGKIVFTTSPAQKEWNGQTLQGELCQDGTYYFTINSSMKIISNGFIHLIRN